MNEHKLDIIIEHIIEIKTEQARQGKQIDVNTKELSEHKEGVIQNRKRIASLEHTRERTNGVMKFLGYAFTFITSFIAIIFYALSYFK